MINVIKALNKMRNFAVKQIHSVREIDDVMNQTISPKKHNVVPNNTNNNSFENLNLGENSLQVKKCHDDSDLEEKIFTEIKKQFKLFDYVASGDPNNIEFIVNCFKNDPELQLPNPNRSRMIVNKLDNNGKSLLYTASIFGNINMVKILIENGADILYRCQVSIVSDQ